MDFEEKMTAEQTSQTSDESSDAVENEDKQVGNAEPGKEQTETDAEQEANDAEFTDGADGDGDHAQEPKQEAGEFVKKPVQSRERNAEEARKRREAEKAEAVSKARIEAIIDATDGVNPYTGNEIKDADDVEEYLAMRQIKKNGGDPLSDYSEYMKNKRREEREAQKKEAERNERARKDIAEFKRANPTVEVSDLFADEKFSKFADGKLGRVPLTTIYSDYRELVGETRNAEQQRAAQALANSRATPGAVATAGSQEDGLYTKEQVAQMSQQEVHDNWGKVEASMAKWQQQ